MLNMQTSSRHVAIGVAVDRPSSLGRRAPAEAASAGASLGWVARFQVRLTAIAEGWREELVYLHGALAWHSTRTRHQPVDRLAELDPRASLLMFWPGT